MWPRSAVIVLALAACGDDRESPAPAEPPADAAVHPGPVIAAPHGGSIVALAVTDRAGAAISIDEHDNLRLWPSLDGTREPVVVRGRSAVELALARTDVGFVAALLDAAGGIELLRFHGDGALLGRRLLPADAGFVELAAGDGTVLARRTDHAIVRIDGRPQTLAPLAGEQILAIAARRDTVLAGLADPERPGEIDRVREIVVGRDLAWGRAFELPVPLAAPIAVSPSGERVVGVAARTRAAVVIELVPTARTIANVRVAEPSERALGFLDDERAIVHASMVQVPQITAVADPWNVTPAQPPRVRLGRGAVVTDGVVIGGHATHLVLAAPDRTRFLGYRDVGPGFLRVTGDQVTLGFSSRVLWLDHALAAARAHEVTNDATGGIAVDDHRLLKSMSSYPATGGTQLQVSLVDGRAGTEAVLGTWPESSNVAYDPATHVLAIPGASSTVPRLRLDPATGKTTPLRPLQTKPYAIIDLFDPARAGGTVAIATWHRGISSRVETFVDDGRSRGPIVAASALTLPARATPIGTDERATVYTLEPGGHVHVYRAGKQVAKLHVGDDLVGGAVDRAGTLIAVYSASHVAVFDRDGNERWRTPVWSTNAARFTEPRALTPARLLVNTQGGIVAYDAATGARAASGCAWGFGLTETEPPVTVFLAPVVCAEGS